MQGCNPCLQNLSLFCFINLAFNDLLVIPWEGGLEPLTYRNNLLFSIGQCLKLAAESKSILPYY